MKTVLLIFAAALLIGCASLQAPGVTRDKQLHVFECPDGSFLATSKTALFSSDGNYKTCGQDKSFKTIEKAVRSIHANGKILKVQKVKVGGFVTNGHTEYLVILK